MAVPRGGGWGGFVPPSSPKSRQILSRKYCIKLVGYTFRLKNCVIIPLPPISTGFFRAGAATAFPSYESCSQIDKFPKYSLHSRISIICECNQVAFCCLLTSYFCSATFKKYTFQVISFRIESTMSLSRLAKVLKLISLCNLYPRTRNYAGVFLTHVPC